MIAKGFTLKKILGLIIKFWILIFTTLIFSYCIHPQENGPKILTEFPERLTALVTTSVRSNLRDDITSQKLLADILPFLEKKTSLNQMMGELKTVDPIKGLAYIVEADIMFELEKTENRKWRENFNSPEVQQSIVSATIAGIKRAISQLRERKDEK